MSTVDGMLERAGDQAREVLAYFDNLDVIGAYAGASVAEQKFAFLCRAFVAFAQQEARREAA